MEQKKPSVYNPKAAHVTSRFVDLFSKHKERVPMARLSNLMCLLLQAQEFSQFLLFSIEQLTSNLFSVDGASLLFFLPIINMWSKQKIYGLQFPTLLQ